MTGFRFVDEHQSTDLCRIAGVARSSFYASRIRTPSQRQQANDELLVEMREIHEQSRRTYGAPRPDQRWVADISAFRCWDGKLYLAGMRDLHDHSLVGWSMGERQTADLVIAALVMALGRRQSGRDLVHHAHHGSQGRPVESAQYLSVRYSERLADNDIVASVGSKGASFDNAMDESFNGLYKWELICSKGPWQGLDDVEFPTLTYVDWFNNRRLHGQIEFGSPSAPVR